MTNKVKILFVEHDRNDVALLTREIKKGGIDYISEVVENEPGYLHALRTFIPDIILSDYTFPSFDGPTAFKIKQNIAPDTPFIFVSGTIGEENSIEYIKNGVTDYALKDKLFTLTPKIKRALKESKEKKEKNKIDHEFRQALNDLQNMMASSLDIICSINEDGRFVNVSSASERILGYKPEELKGRKYIELVVPGDVEKTNKAAAEIMRGLPVTMFENQYIHKNRDTVPMIWSATWDDADKMMYCVAKDITERKKLENAFESERMRFSELFLQAPFSMGILKGENHVFEMANPLYLELIGKKDILGKTVKEVLPEIENQGFIELLDTVYNTGTPFSANEMLIQLYKENTGGFADIYLNFTYQVYKDNAGIIEGIFFFAVEVTEQVLSRKKIEESENRFRAIIEKSAEMITLSTESGRMLYGSPSISKAFGYSLKDIEQTLAFNFIHPDDVQDFKENRKIIVQNPGKSHNSQLRLLHKNGDWIWCEATITNMLNEVGVHAMVANFRDISEKKITEQQREFDRNNLKALINNTTDLMWSVDLDFKLITFNQPFYEAIRLMSGKELIEGSNVFSAILSQEQSDRFKISYARAFTGEAFTEVEYIPRPVEFWSEISYYPIRKGNEVIGTACHSRDISERKLAELERTKITSDLIQHNKDLEQFAYIISHNLRAPVANIIGIAGAIHSGKLQAEQEKQMLGHLNTSVKKLDEIIKDLNHILEVRHGVTQQKEVVRFSQLLETIQLSISSLIGKEDVHFITDFSAVDEIKTLKSYLYSIFFNLISNSIKYRSPEISPVIEISTNKTPGKIGLIFKDNGLGIDLEKRGQQVFGLYKRFHAHTEGKGMGLYMVKSQVETLGGTIAIFSEVDKGTEFRIEFNNG